MVRPRATRQYWQGQADAWAIVGKLLARLARALETKSARIRREKLGEDNA